MSQSNGTPIDGTEWNSLFTSSNAKGLLTASYNVTYLNPWQPGVNYPSYSMVTYNGTWFYALRDVNGYSDFTQSIGTSSYSITSSQVALPGYDTSSWLQLSTQSVYVPGNSYTTMDYVNDGTPFVCIIPNSLPPVTGSNNQNINYGWTQTPLSALNRLRNNVSNIVTYDSNFAFKQSVSGEPTEDGIEGWPIASPNFVNDNQMFYYPDTGRVESVTSSVQSRLQVYGKHVGELDSMTQAVWSSVYGFTQTASAYMQMNNNVTYVMKLGGDTNGYINGTLTLPVYWQPVWSASVDYSTVSNNYVQASTDYALAGLPAGVTVTLPSSLISTISTSYNNVIGPNSTQYIIHFQNTLLTAGTEYEFTINTVKPGNNYWSTGIPATTTYSEGCWCGTNDQSLLYVTTMYETNDTVNVNGVHSKKQIKRINMPKYSGSYPPLVMMNNYTQTLIQTNTGSTISGITYGYQGITTGIWDSSNPQIYTETNDSGSYAISANSPSINASTYGYWFAKTLPNQGINVDMQVGPDSTFVKDDGTSLTYYHGNPPIKTHKPYQAYYNSDYGLWFYTDVYPNYKTQPQPLQWSQYTYYPLGFQVSDESGSLWECISGGVSDVTNVMIESNYNVGNTITESRNGIFSSGSNTGYYNDTAAKWKCIYKPYVITGSVLQLSVKPKRCTVPCYPVINDNQSWQPNTNYVFGQLIRDTNGSIRQCIIPGKTYTTQPNWGNGSGVGTDPQSSPAYGLYGSASFIREKSGSIYGVGWFPYTIGWVPTNWIYKVYAERSNGISSPISFNLGCYRNASFTSFGTYNTGQTYDCMWPVFTNAPLVYQCNESINVQASILLNQTVGYGQIGVDLSPMSYTYFRDMQRILDNMT